MAQRNPMNERYQGDGPQGKTRKSAAKLKPKVEAASSVHIDKKPTNQQERKAARKKRDAQLAAKESERKRKAEERDRREREAAGEVVEAPSKASLGARVKQIFFAPPQNTASGSSLGKASSSTATGAKGAPASAARTKGPDTPEYHRLRRIYWTLLGIGVAAIVVSILINATAGSMMDGWGSLLPMAVAYPAVIAAMILDFTKIKKMRVAHEAGASGKQSPKQQKHMQNKAEAAAMLEASKKTQRDLKRAQSRIPFIASKAKTAIDTGDAAGGDEQKEATDEVATKEVSDMPKN